MRKRICTALMIGCLALTACGSTGQQRLEAARTRMAEAETMSMTAQVQADFGETIEQYTLEYSYDGDCWTAVVLEPAFVAGITARISEDTSELEYDGAILVTGDLTGNGIAPISAVPLIHETVRKGMTDCVWEEGDLLAGTFLYDDAISVSVWFDAEGLPAAAELIESGTVKAKCILTNVKEATHGTTENTDLGGNQPKESGT